MALVSPIKHQDWVSVRQAIAHLGSQKFGPGSFPTFGGLTLSGLSPSSLIATDSSKLLSSVSSLASWVAGTTNQINITDDSDGTITLSVEPACGFVDVIFDCGTSDVSLDSDVSFDGGYSL